MIFPEIMALAQANERMGDLFHWLRTQPGCSNVSSRMDTRLFHDSFAVKDVLAVTIQVRGDLATGNGVTFTIETQIRDGVCVVEASASVNMSESDEELQSTILDVANRDAYAPQLNAAMDELWLSRQKNLDRAMIS